MKIGIIFGGPSREREISFAGGRTVYDNLDKALFEAVPVFADSLGNFILLDWQYIYKGTIRDFYPPVEALPHSAHELQIYLESLGELSEAEQESIMSRVGKRILPHQFKEHFDFAFLALHGPYGEDGSVQGLLEWYRVPYSGSGILPSAIGIDKILQKDYLHRHGFAVPRYRLVAAEEWAEPSRRPVIMEQLTRDLGLPLVLKAPHQGSSIGVSILKTADLATFEAAMARSFFVKTIEKATWQELTPDAQLNLVKQLTDIREGIGLPVRTDNHVIIHHPEQLLEVLNGVFEDDTRTSLTLTHVESEPYVLVESFIQGQEFSCIVIQDQHGNPLALPPTEIIKGGEVFDYCSKYLPGLSRKITPINLPDEQIQRIRQDFARSIRLGLHRACYFNKINVIIA